MTLTDPYTKNLPVAPLPESWHCVDCDANTAPNLPNRAELMELAVPSGRGFDALVDEFVRRINDRHEIYTARDAVWKAAGMEPFGGCLCIGCLEKRLGRRLRPKDFLRGHPLNALPGTPRLRQRRGPGERPAVF